MKDSRCEENASLIGFLYEDCEADERARIAAHVAVCATCAGELEALSATRDHLSAWTPPDVQLGFQMSQPSAAPTARWWSRPMPAWAQLAAAVVIFASGAAVGMANSNRAATATAFVLPPPSATPGEIRAIEQRLSQVEARPIMSVSRVELDDATRAMLLERVEHLLDVRESRQNVIVSEQLDFLQRKINKQDENVVRLGNNLSSTLGEFKLASSTDRGSN
jgi:hypothetical protein